VYVFGVCEVNEQVAVVVPPAVRVAEVGHDTMSPARDAVEPILTTPANPKVAAGLPRLVRVTRTPPPPVVGKLTLVELESILYPLTKTVSVP
jgi:hypothetical protein